MVTSGGFGWPFIDPIIKITCIVIMTFNQHHDILHIWAWGIILLLGVTVSSWDVRLFFFLKMMTSSALIVGYRAEDWCWSSVLSVGKPFLKCLWLLQVLKKRQRWSGRKTLLIRIIVNMQYIMILTWLYVWFSNNHIDTYDVLHLTGQYYKTRSTTYRPQTEG